MTQTLLIIHIIALSIGIGGGLANMFAAIQMRSAPPAAMPHLGAVQKKVGRASFVAIILLWITGIWMLTLRGGAGDTGLAFSVKMAAVLVLTFAALAMQWQVLKAGRAGKPPSAPAMARLGQVAGLASLTAVICAVIAFS